jgi:hypothetical protein
MTGLLIALAVAASSTPTVEGERLARGLAEQGTLASLLPVIRAKETAELLEEDPTLTAADKAKLRATADRVFDASYKRLIDATGKAYAKQLSVPDLQALSRFFASDVAKRYRAATPTAIASTMQSAGQIDFKGDVRKAFCTATKHLCTK